MIDPFLSPEPEVSGARMTVWLLGAKQMANSAPWAKSGFLSFPFFLGQNKPVQPLMPGAVHLLPFPVHQHVSIFPAGVLPVWPQKRVCKFAFVEQMGGKHLHISSTFRILTPRRFVCASKDGRMTFVHAYNKYQCRGPCLSLLSSCQSVIMHGMFPPKFQRISFLKNRLFLFPNCNFLVDFILQNSFRCKEKL